MSSSYSSKKHCDEEEFVYDIRAGVIAQPVIVWNN